jgi:hypothetical protein
MLKKLKGLHRYNGSSIERLLAKAFGVGRWAFSVGRFSSAELVS